jgi:hypothetical protein
MLSKILQKEKIKNFSKKKNKRRETTYIIKIKLNIIKNLM